MPSRLDITQDIQPLTTFRNNSVEFIKQLKETKRPIILTVNGKPEAVPRRIPAPPRPRRRVRRPRRDPPGVSGCSGRTNPPRPGGVR